MHVLLGSRGEMRGFHCILRVSAELPALEVMVGSNQRLCGACEMPATHISAWLVSLLSSQDGCIVIPSMLWKDKCLFCLAKQGETFAFLFLLLSPPSFQILLEIFSLKSSFV